MRCICHLVLALWVALLPVQSAAQNAQPVAKKKQTKSAAAADEAREAERAQEPQHRRRRHKAQPKVLDAAPQEGTATASDAPKNDAASGDNATASASSAPAPASEDDEGDLEDNPTRWIQVLSQKVPPRRYAYVIGVVLGAVGLAFAYQAQGEAKRAQTITSAAEAQNAVASAQSSASLANIMYGLAAFAVLTAFVLEFLPEPAAEKARLTFHF